ncbi:hypothetical protein PHISCL_11307, partial [Aspergillus sclerotialis]
MVHTAGNILRGITRHVPHENDGIVEELAELAIREDESAKGLETFQGLIAVLLSGSL